MNIEKYIFMENGIKMIDVVGALMEAMFECEEEGLSPMDLVQKEAKRIYKNETRLP